MTTRNGNISLRTASCATPAARLPSREVRVACACAGLIGCIVFGVMGGALGSVCYDVCCNRRARRADAEKSDAPLDAKKGVVAVLEPDSTDSKDAVEAKTEAP